MNKFKKIAIGGLSSIAVVPVLVTVACGASSTPKHIVIPKIVKDIITSPYSKESLTNEINNVVVKAGSKLEKDDKWRSGITLESLESTHQFISGLAEKLGYDSDEFYKKSGYTIIKDGESNQLTKPDFSLTAEWNKWAMSEVMSKLSAKTLPSGFGETRESDDYVTDLYAPADNLENPRYQMDWSKTGLKPSTDNFKNNYFDVDTHELKISSKGDANGLKRISYVNPSKPGEVRFNWVDTQNKVIRKMNIENMYNTHSIMDDTYFEENIIPYAKEITIQFADLLIKNASLATNYISAETIDQVKWIFNNFMVRDNTLAKTIFKVDKLNLFEQVLKEMNNGSQHWIAMLAFFKGLDETNFDYQAAMYNNISETFVNPIHTNGLNSLNQVSELADWGYHQKLHFNVTNDKNSLGVFSPVGFALSFLPNGSALAAPLTPIHNDIQKMLSDFGLKYQIDPATGFDVFRLGGHRVAYYPALSFEENAKRNNIPDDMQKDLSNIFNKIVELRKATEAVSIAAQPKP